MITWDASIGSSELMMLVLKGAIKTSRMFSQGNWEKLTHLRRTDPSRGLKAFCLSFTSLWSGLRQHLPAPTALSSSAPRAGARSPTSQTTACVQPRLTQLRVSRFPRDCRLQDSKAPAMHGTQASHAYYFLRLANPKLATICHLPRTGAPGRGTRR